MVKSMEKTYRLRQPELIDSPALIVIPDLVQSNIRHAIEMVGNPNRLRPHIKTHKSPELTRLQMAAGITQFKCATIAEAELLGREKAPDVLLAIPVNGPKIKRLLRLIRHFPETRFSCLVDHPETVRQLEQALDQAGLMLEVFLDLNTGMNRTGIEPGTEAFRLYDRLMKSSVLRPRGLHAYDGHIRDTDIQKRKAACDAAFAPVEKLAGELANAGAGSIEIIAGGSPSFPIHAARTNVVCSPGTFVYWDQGYKSGCPEQGFQCAAYLLTRVLSLPKTGLATLDLGHKAVASENELTKRVYFPALRGWMPIGHSEEHLVLEQTDINASPIQPGDVLYGIPWHICPTVALYERVYCMENGELTGEWENWARYRKQSF